MGLPGAEWRRASRFLATASTATALSLPLDAADAATDAALVAFSLPTVAALEAAWKPLVLLTFSLPTAAATAAEWNAFVDLAACSACMPLSLPTVATVSAAKKSVLPARLAMPLKFSIVDVIAACTSTVLRLHCATLGYTTAHYCRPAGAAQLTLNE